MKNKPTIILAIILSFFIGTVSSLKYQLLINRGRVEENFTGYDGNNPYNAYIYDAYFFSDYSSLNSYTSYGTHLSYIKRSENEVYTTIGDSLNLFPTLEGNHPTKYLLYTHLRYVADENKFTFKVNYFTCIENAVKYKSAQDTVIGVQFTSIWLTSGVHTPGVLKEVNSLAYPYYNFPYPIVANQYAENLLNEVTIKNLIVYKSQFSDWEEAANYEAAVANSSDDCSSSAALFSNTDILIPIQLLSGDSSKCSYIPNVAGNTASDMYNCNQTPNTKYNEGTTCLDNMYVMGVCHLNGSSTKLDYTSNILLANDSTNSQPSYTFAPTYFLILKKIENNTVA